MVYLALLVNSERCIIFKGSKELKFDAIGVEPIYHLCVHWCMHLLR